MATYNVFLAWCGGRYAAGGLDNYILLTKENKLLSNRAMSFRAGTASISSHHT
jgi:hypothetical protein